MKGTKWMILLCAAMLSCGMTVSAAPFDPAYYAAQNPDVVQAVGEDGAALELHYNTFGAAEGRAANAQDAAARNAAAQKTGSIASFEEFDPEYYAEQNPDVTALLGADPAALYAHYVMNGAAEGRASSAAEAAENEKAAEASRESAKAEENPYARFASSAASSKSSKHSKHSDDENDDDADADDDSGSAPAHIVYDEKTYKPVDDYATDNQNHIWSMCNVENCEEDGHRGVEACTMKPVPEDEEYHINKCTKCGGLGERSAHDSNWDARGTDSATPQHRKTCPTCDYDGEWVDCDVYISLINSKCRRQCKVHGYIGTYQHTEDDWDENGRCNINAGCGATRED